MNRIGKAKGAAAAIAVTTGVACALLIPASPAVAYYSGGLFLDITVESPARLVAGGAALTVPVEFTCNSTDTAVAVNVTQRVNGKAIASGYGDVRVACTGAHQHTTVTVTASGNKAFSRGEAFATGRVNGCLPGYVNCGTEYDDTTIQISR
jgi:hypothetical protein